MGSCTKSNSVSDIPVYSYLTPPVPPPPVFQVVYNLSTYGDKEALITFDSSAVWLIEKLGDGRINYFVKNDSTSRNIYSKDTLGLKAGYTYRFVANNNNYDEFKNFFTQFTRLPNDYASFPQKF
ncbi:MAG: hypothetical protein KKB74_07770 [Bacteroidetes bacterium]|nr:hypothetical protein [Bacteroidota bacterium]